LPQLQHKRNVTIEKISMAQAFPAIQITQAPTGFSRPPTGSLGAAGAWSSSADRLRSTPISRGPSASAPGVLLECSGRFPGIFLECSRNTLGALRSGGAGNFDGLGLRIF
jgi:hypothetical protein